MFNACLAEGGDGTAIAVDGHDIEGFLEALEEGDVSIEDDDIVVCLAEDAGHFGANVACSDDEYAHGGC